ncbi:hypothetical protein [Bremerella cremea]|uniref:hypothetical protein n=1 Tax=Bremerella cremea TaxID=1031537 RepID=UPI0031EFC1C7
MNTPPNNSEPELEVVDEPMAQFGLSHIMGLLTGLAFLFALAAPFLRTYKQNELLIFVAIVTIQTGVMGITVFYFMIRRKSLVQRSGKRIGIGYPGTIPGKHTPALISSLALLMIGLAQLCLAILFTSMPLATGIPFYLVQQIQLGSFAGAFLMQLSWGRPIGTVEFFENGAVQSSFHMIPWQDVVLRPSAFQEDRVVMVYKVRTQLKTIDAKGLPHFHGQITKFTSTLQILEPIRSYLLDHYGEKPATEATA